MNDWIKQHIHGVIGAILYIVFVIVLLLLLGFKTPLPLPPEEAILIDFAGGGNRDAGASLSASHNEQNASSQNTSTSGVNTQSFEDAASMQSSTVPTVNNTPNTQTNTDQTTTQNTKPTNPNADRINNLFSGNVFGNGTGSGSSGTGTGSGNPGTGLDGSGSGTGPGGVGGSITGRRKVFTVEPTPQENLTGKVVLRITVNERGDVTDVSLVSTTCDRCVRPAMDAVRQWKYEPKPGTGYQTGNVTIEFKQT
ncbi:MAG TPA: TonB family protein [Bacteroidales bacterium]|nr:TonB family protein [Bacteroidales bacterium]HOL97432.1 TonB family protein [Bacteroidales bacterium]HUM31767.1 TonB family protein [Bacteroidales bacterium]